ncbi:MAG: hypothetical protein IK080_07695 [Clostridia bacterium]|nr:hypothetical protein [Clostridia bacterium]
MNKLIAFMISVLMLFGVFGGQIEVKSEIEMQDLSFSGVDITDGYTISLPLRDGSARFNRIGFSYHASAAVRAVFEYRQGFKNLQEELLLSSKEQKASMLLDGYLDRRTASRLISVCFAPIIEGQPCVLSVSDFTCDLQTVPGKDVLYIENDNYKAGVSLRWGGGLCYFEDKQNGAYGNLLNCHDTGRLVQQSYYGPMEIEGYENGVYENTRWNYNPVQGGDMYGNTSKLVALEKTEQQIRVVCRPLDWAQDHMLTQTYYTSVYTLTGSGLSVENTAVDFLQTPWAVRAQEIPAFYTISALGTFVFYDGDAPWTGAPLRVEKELSFWGGKPAFDLQDGNDETWCVWTDDSAYGIGLYSPIASSLLAGRFMYDGTSDADANPTNYVAPLGFFKLDFDAPFTYTYRLTAGSVQEIRDTFQNLR